MCNQVLKDLDLLRELLRSNLARFQCSGGKDLRIVVFIDDIDRCKPSSIIEVSLPGLAPKTRE